MTHQKHQFDTAPFTVDEAAFRSRFSLRVKPAHRAAVGTAIGLDLPEKVGARFTNGPREVLCLGPDEWLILADDSPALTDASRAAYGYAPHSLVEISDREITYTLRGAAVVDALACCCPRDVAAMPVGSAARTVFDAATVVLWRDGATDFRMDVWRSFTPHVQSLLAQVQREFAAGL